MMIIRTMKRIQWLRKRLIVGIFMIVAVMWMSGAMINGVVMLIIIAEVQ